jgi:RNA polymerase sigma-70 factor (ECF subfamily)
MTPAAPQPVVAPPDNPVRRALDDPETRDGLLKHALAILGRRLAGCPAKDRLDKAEEACQETLARALQKCHQYDGSRPVRPWLHGIMNNVLAETSRALRRSPVQDVGDTAAWNRLVVDLGSDPADIVAGSLDVEVYLTKLPSEHREVLRLRFYEGLSNDGLAARLGISLGNARVRLCRALNAIREIAGASPREKRP